MIGKPPGRRNRLWIALATHEFSTVDATDEGTNYKVYTAYFHL